MIEWAWGVSRLIDGLYKTAEPRTRSISSASRVTGCSFQGKMALYAGAFDERIALTIPEESGGGGEASWRFMATQTGTEDLEAAQGTAWYAHEPPSVQERRRPEAAGRHARAGGDGRAARDPARSRTPASIGSEARPASVSMKAATEVYKALGIPDRIGFHAGGRPRRTARSRAASPRTCRPSSTSSCAAWRARTRTIAKSSYNTDLTKWITWTTPTLQ